MDPGDTVEKILNDVVGVLHAEIMNDDLTDIINTEEGTVTSMVGAKVINEAFHLVATRDVRICMFCDNRIVEHDKSTMTLEDDEGNVLGMILQSNAIDEYKDRTDVLWVSDDFIMFPNVEPKGGEKFILKPMSFPYLTEDDGCFDIVMASPAPSSDMLLKKYFGRSSFESTSTLVVGYNHRKSINP